MSTKYPVLQFVTCTSKCLTHTNSRHVTAPTDTRKEFTDHVSTKMDKTTNFNILSCPTIT